MEAATERNKLEEGLTNNLAQLRFDRGLPINAGEVISGIEESMVSYFTQNGDETKNSWTSIDEAFAPIGQLFSNEADFVVFLNQLVARLDARRNLILEPEEQKENNMNWQVYEGIRTCINCIKETSHRIEEAPIRTMRTVADAIHPKMPLEQRYEIAQRLKIMLAWLASVGRLSTSSRYSMGEDTRTLTPEEVEGLSHDVEVNFHYSDGVSSTGGLNRIIEIIEVVETEKNLMDNMGNIDKEGLNRNRLRFGAKGANLLEVQELLPRFARTKFKNVTKDISIPPFDLVDIDVYKKWLLQKDEIISYFEKRYEQKWKGKPLMVRSSAVHSEDGDNMTGAGIYESVALDENHTFEDFLAAIGKVYESCNSDKAKRYREENRVEEEFMGLVIQERIEYPDLSYVNSTRPYSDDTADLKDEYRAVPIIFDTLRFDELTFLGEHGLDIFQYASRVQSEFLNRDSFDSTQMVAFARFLERYYGQPVQIEFSEESKWGERNKFHFFQARPLPAKMFEAPKVEFPKDVQAIYECSAEGVCDEVLDVLKVYDDNTNKKGFVVYRTSWQGSLERSSLERAMPKEGAAMILSVTEPGRGHIETLALERGVTLLFHQRKDLFETRLGPIMAETRDRISQCFERRTLGLNGDFAGHKKIRIVANGKIARIYPVAEPAA